MPPPPAELYTLSLHDALPILKSRKIPSRIGRPVTWGCSTMVTSPPHSRTCSNSPFQIDSTCSFGNIGDRKTTRLNSSHLGISYAVFCLKKKKKKLNDNAASTN